jgi:UDP-glucose 4-epimerase
VKILPRNDHYTVIGGAGFIGSHTIRKLLSFQSVKSVQAIDNLSSGTLEHIADSLEDPRFTLHEFSLGKDQNLHSLIRPGETLIHFASNPDIAKAATEPTIDFYQGTVLTNEVAEAARLGGATTILYASGSGVYGDHGTAIMNEIDTPLVPISTYGSSKLAGEALLRAYAYMFDIKSIAFRFGNVIGPMQTHGVGYDFLHQLSQNHGLLHVLGDGKQSKTYVHVDDVVDAILMAEGKVSTPFEVFNVGTDDYITVAEIADLAIEVFGQVGKTDIHYSGGRRGWKGDVPVMRLDTNKIRGIGWTNSLTTNQAMKSSLEVMAKQIQKNNYDQTQ